jgi:hypothetical protein
VLVGQFNQRGVEAGQRCEHTHVGGGGLGDDGRDLVATLFEHQAKRVDVVVRQHEGLPGGRLGDTGRAGEGEGSQA